MLRKRPRTRRGLTAAIALGIVGGMRSALPPAVIAVRDKRPRSRLLRLGIVLGSAGELVADKLPSTPSRTAPPALAGRFASGGAVGRQCAGTFGGLVGGASAVGSAFVSHNARQDLVKKTGLPDPVIAVAEDSIAIAIARFATRRPLDTRSPATGADDASESALPRRAKPPRGRKAKKQAAKAADAARRAATDAARAARAQASHAGRSARRSAARRPRRRWRLRRRSHR